MHLRNLKFGAVLVLALKAFLQEPLLVNKWPQNLLIQFVGSDNVDHKISKITYELLMHWKQEVKIMEGNKKGRSSISYFFRTSNYERKHLNE